MEFSCDWKQGLCLEGLLGWEINTSWADVSGALPKSSHLVPSGHTGPTSTISPSISLLGCFSIDVHPAGIGQSARELMSLPVTAAVNQSLAGDGV